MKLYFEIAKFNFLKMLMYPWEVVAFVFNRLILLGSTIIFWLAVSKGNSSLFNFRELLAYFFVVNAVRDLSFSTNTRFGRDIQKDIKSGEINNVLVKPVRMIPFLFAGFVGENGSMFIYAIFMLIAGVIILPPKNSLNLVLFFIFLFLALLLSVAVNICIGIIAFYSPEAGGIQNVCNHILKVLSGMLIPIIYFPALTRKIILLTPFPSLAFIPTFMLQNSVSTSELLKTFFVTIFWVVFLSVVSNYLWRKSLKQYEGVGI